MKQVITLLITLFLLAWTGLACAANQAPIGLNDVIATVEKSFRQISDNQAPPISNFAANFFQRTRLAAGQREMRGEGQLTVSLPSETSPLMFRFEYFRPSQQEIVSDGKSLWIYHPENREVILIDVSFLYDRNSFTPNRGQAVNFLHGLGRISKDFQINFAPGVYDAAANYVLELTPRRSMLNTRRILIVVNRESVLSYVTGKTPLTTPNSVPSPRTKGSFPQPRSPFGTQPPFGSQPDLGTQLPFGASALNSDPFPILSTTVYDQEGNNTTMEFTNIQVNDRISETMFMFSIPPGVQTVRPSEQTLPR